MKKILPLLLVFTLLLTACSQKGSKDDSSVDTLEISDGQVNIFDGLKGAEKLDTDWLFIPEKAVVLRKSTENGEYRISFKGAEYPEINAYGEDIFNTLTGRGAIVYNAADLLHPVKLDSFTEAELDISFAGTAYSYYYKLDGRIYMIVIKYYGSAGGTYGNGQSELRFDDVTDRIASLLEE